MKRFALFLLVSCLLAAPNCEAQMLKKLGQELLNGASGGGMPGMNGAGTAGQPAGQTNLPPGQYMMSNMSTGQGYYILVDGNGQMYASLPNGVQNQGMTQQNGMMGGATGGGIGGLLQNFTGGQNNAYPVQQQQQQGGVGGLMRGPLGNFLKQELTPQQQVQPQF